MLHGECHTWCQRMNFPFTICFFLSFFLRFFEDTILNYIFVQIIMSHCLLSKRCTSQLSILFCDFKQYYSKKKGKKTTTIWKSRARLRWLIVTATNVTQFHLHADDGAVQRSLLFECDTLKILSCAAFSNWTKKKTFKLNLKRRKNVSHTVKFFQ